MTLSQHCAAAHGRFDVLALLLQHGADVNETADHGSDEFTALHFAARDNHLECVQLLVQAGAASDRKCSRGYTAAQAASDEGVRAAILTAGQLPARL